MLPGEADLHLQQEEIAAFPLQEALCDDQVVLTVTQSGTGYFGSAGAFTSFPRHIHEAPVLSSGLK